MDSADQAARVAGGLAGLLIGNALAVPFDGLASSLIPPRMLIQMAPIFKSRSRFPQLPPGTYSEEGATTLIMLSTLLNHNGFDDLGFMQRLQAWLTRGYYAADNQAHDVNPQTQRAVQRFSAGMPADRCGGGVTVPNDAAAVVRAVPLALLHQGDDASLIELAMRQAALTHDTPLSRVGSAAFALWARSELQQDPDAWGTAADTLERLLPADGPLREAFKTVYRPKRAILNARTDRVEGLLYVPYNVLNAETDYAAALRRLISFGDQLNTACAAAGAIAGIRGGLYSIPAEWRATLREGALVQTLINEMLGRLNLPVMDL